MSHYSPDVHIKLNVSAQPPTYLFFQVGLLQFDFKKYFHTSWIRPIVEVEGLFLSHPIIFLLILLLLGINRTFRHCVSSLPACPSSRLKALQTICHLDASPPGQFVL